VAGQELATLLLGLTAGEPLRSGSPFHSTTLVSGDFGGSSSATIADGAARLVLQRNVGDMGRPCWPVTSCEVGTVTGLIESGERGRGLTFAGQLLLARCLMVSRARPGG